MDYLTREQISNKMQDEGLGVTERTLRFWEAEHMMPSAVIVDGRAVHEPSVLGTVRMLAATRPKQLSRLRKNGHEKVEIVKITEDELVLRISYRRGKEKDG